MHLTSTVKSVILIVAFATQCVCAKSRNGHGKRKLCPLSHSRQPNDFLLCSSAYFDEKFCVLEWIIYLKQLSLIALMLCGVVLYYVPKSRSYARRACCILIDTVANGLKFALNTNGTDREKIKARNETVQNEELRIQELYRKVYEEDTKDHGQIYGNKTNFDNGIDKSIRKHKSKKYRTGHNDGKRHRHNHHRDADNNVLPESDAVVVSTITSPQQISIIDEKCEKDNAEIPQNTCPEMKITTYVSADNLRNKTHLRKFKTASPKQEDVSNIDTDIELQTKQNFRYMKHKEDSIAPQHQLSKDCATRIINKPMDPHYDRVKPVLLRVVNWLFGGCPEASRRHREQVDKVGKEEIFKSTNMWLPETSELYLQQ
ncbi:PREDICTED: uncharacterized protein LOC105567120 isoform X2 [Vollenhovia emeryi]|uniref:uncharacterized protein LOC105567120 isoform X2 n=1 Tax=Vollenhovia emeryi TaxID=411798 RepID=UPI0005F37F93|nr:PREDICTED: uncharacterized protein LOC105567120 isoform X2 [Vollenhovia emeryi]